MLTTNFQKPRNKRGFTLAELLVALGVLGIIASFTIPKIMYASSESQKKAVFKDTVSTISEVVFRGYSENILKTNISNDTYMDYLAENMSHVKYCQSDSNGEGCSGGQLFWGWSPGNRRGLLLHNGVFLMMFGVETGCASRDTAILFVDLNNGQPPNSQNEDQFELQANLSNVSCQGVKPGQMAPHGNSRAFYDGLFK